MVKKSSVANDANMLKIHILKHGTSHLSQGSKNNKWQTESVVLGEFLDRVVFNHSANDDQDWKWTKTHFLFCLFLTDQASASGLCFFYFLFLFVCFFIFNGPALHLCCSVSALCHLDNIMQSNAFANS